MSTSTSSPIGLAVKLPFATAKEFADRYGANLSRGGIYLRSKNVRPCGTPITLDLRLSGGERIIYASAVVTYTTGEGGAGAPGMGLKFTVVDAATRRFLDGFAADHPHARIQEPPEPKGVAVTRATPAGAERPSGPAPSTVPSLPPASAPSGAPALAAAAPKNLLAPQVAKGPSAPPFEPPAEEPKRSGPIIGVDLGTTNSCAAFVKDGKPVVLRSREGYNTVPSIVALNARGKLVIGHPAKGQMQINPRLTVYGAKRLIGRAFDSPVVQQIKGRFHYEIVSGPDGEAAVQISDQVYTLQQISALILREVRELAQVQLGEPVSRAVITVPAYYNDNQRQAVREAGRLAGLLVERIINEPTSAALAYGFGRKLKQRVLVYDLGGGTFDASVLELNDTLYEVVSTGGDTFLGGIDFDNTLVAHLLEGFHKKNGVAFEGDKVALQRIAEAAERAKCTLSESAETRVHVPFVTMVDNKPLDLDVTVTRDELWQLTGKLVDRTIEVCGEVLKAKGLTAKDVDEVILVGGQSRAPLVQERITAFFGKPPVKNVHPDEAVALGAAMLAHSLGSLEGLTLIDVLPMAIGVGLPGGRFKAIMERNSPLPAQKAYRISTAREGQTELEITIFQGESDRVEANEYLGTFRAGSLPPGPKGAVTLEITFELSSECLLTVTGKELGSGREISSTFTTKGTPEEIKSRLAKAGEGLSGRTAEHPIPEAAVLASGSGGLFGWFKRLFGRSN